MKIILSALRIFGSALLVAILAVILIGFQTTEFPKTTVFPKTTLIGSAGAAGAISTFSFNPPGCTSGTLCFNPTASNNYWLPNSINGNTTTGASPADARSFFANDSLISGTIVSATMNWYQGTDQIGTSIWTIKLCDFSVNLTCTAGGLLGTIGTISPVAANCATPADKWCSVTSGAVSWAFTAGHVYGIRLEVDAGGTGTKSEVLAWNVTLKLN